MIRGSRVVVRIRREVEERASEIKEFTSKSNRDDCRHSWEKQGEWV